MPIRVPVEQTGLERSIQNAAKSAGRNLKINLGSNAKDIKSLEQPLGRITGQADEFTKSMEAANARVLAFGASVGIINAVVQSFKTLVSTTVEVEKSLAKINSILQTSVSGLDSLKGQIFDIARGTEQTFDTVADAALELSRQGLSATEVTKRLNDSLILSRLSGISAAEAVSGLTAAVNSFTKAGLTTGEVLNKISNAANQFAVSERDLIEGFKRSASVAELAGVSIDELGGIITAVQQKTARGGAVIGNSFKTIFTRIGRSENLDLLSSIGVQVTDLQGKILPATKLIENLAKQLDSLGDVEIREITQKIGGGFQIAPLLAALSDYSSQNSIAIQATQAFASASDQAYKKNEALNQTLSAAINRTTLSVKELANTLGELGVTDTFRTLLDFFNNLATGAEKILDGEGLGGKFARGIVKGLGTALIQGGLALFGVLILKLSGQLAKFGLESVKTFFNLNKEAKRVQATQQQIVSTLLSDKGIREQILKIENSSVSTEQKRAQQAEFFNTALQKQLSTLSQINAVSAGIASPIARATSSKSVKRGASGYLPVGAEQKDINSGVGGAPKGSKPVVIPNFAFGGGQRGTMVANNSEYIVPNFAGGGSAIFNQDMVKSMGLPSGAKKINAAGGYVPNFAKFKFGTAKGTDFQRASAVSGSTVGGKYGGKVVTQDDINKASLFVKNNESAQQASRRTSTFNTYDANKKPNSAVMLTPEPLKFLQGGLNLKYTKDKFIETPSSPKTKVSQFLGGYAGINPNLNESNSKFSKLLKLEEIIDDSLADSANTTLSAFAKIGKLKTDPVKYNAKEVKSLFLKEGGAGALTAYKGAIFEGLINAISGGVETGSDSSLDIKFQGESGKVLKEIFGLEGKGFQFGDFKASDSQGNKDKYRNQLFKNLPKELEKKVITKREKRPDEVSSALKVRGKAAGGYIPNFANGGALEEAIQREKDAGVPINQIRINQNGKLRNSQNPNGIAVTNTRDEPTGAIPQNAARGYTPNFAFAPNPEAAARTEKIPQREFKGLDKLNKSADGASKSIDQTSKSSTDAAGKLFGISAITFALQGAFGGLADETNSVKKGFLEVAQGITQGVSTLTALNALGADVSVGGIAESFNFEEANEKGQQAKAFFEKQSQKQFDRKGKNPKFFSKGIGGNAFGGIFKFISGPMGKLVGGFTRLIPVVGGLVTAFQVLDPIFKKFGLDLGAIGGKLFEKIGQAINIIDTPAEKSAKALEDFADRVEKTLADGGQKNILESRLLELQAKRRGVDTKGKSAEEIAAEVRAKNVASATKQFGTNKNIGLDKILGLEDLTQRSKLRVAGVQYGGGKTQGFSRDTEVEQFKVNGKLTTEEAFIATDRNISAAKRILSAQLYNLIDPKLLKGIDSSTSEGKKQIQDLLTKKTKEIFGDEKSKKALADALSGFAGQLAINGPVGAPRAEETLIKSLFNIPTFKSATSNLGDNETELQNQEVKKVQLEILEIQRKSNLERAKTLASIKSQTQFQLELRNASKETSQLEKSNIQEQIRGLESQRKLSEQLTDSFTKRVQDSDAIRRLSSADGAGKVIVADYDKVNKILSETNNKLRAGANFEGDTAKSLEKKLIALGVQDTLAKKFIGSLSAEQSAIRALSRLDDARNNLAKARLDVLKAQATEEAKILKIRDKALISSRSSEDSKSRQDALRIEGRRLKLEAGTIGQSDRGSLSNKKAIANLGIESAKNEAAKSLRTLIRSLQDELIKDIRSSGLSGDEKRSLESSVTSAKSEEGIVDIAGKVQTAIEKADEENALNAKARQKAAEETLKLEAANIANFKTAISSFDNLAETMPIVIAAAIAKGPDASGISMTGSGSNVGIGVPTQPFGGKISVGSEGFDIDGDSLLPQRSVQQDAPAPVSSGNPRDFGNIGSIYGSNRSQIRSNQTQEAIDNNQAESQLRVDNAIQQAANSTDQLSESLQNFSNIARGAIQGLSDSLAQSQFNAFTSADPSSIQSSLIDIRGNQVARDALAEGDSNEDAIRKMNEFIALENKRSEIRTTISTASRVDLEFELEKTEKILALRNKSRQAIKSGASDSEIDSIQAQIEKEQRRTQSISDRLKKITITGETAFERIRSGFADGADQFVSTLSSGLVDAIANGESLGDVLRGAASDFASKMAKIGLDNLFRGTLGGLQGFSGGARAPIPAYADGGMITGGSGAKDDVPAVLMGGEYVMKKSAVQKYGPNFMNALNSGRIEGYNQGGLVRTESGAKSSSWTPSSDETEEREGYRKPQRDVRTESGVLASLWTRDASYIDSKKSELDKGLDYRSDSGLFVSRWTPKSIYEGKEEFEKEYFEEEDLDRAESGVVVSSWTKEASQRNTNKDSSKSGRAESGLEASKWTKESSLQNIALQTNSANIAGRVESGLGVSRWSSSNPAEATNTESFGKTIAVDFLNEIKSQTSKSIPETLSSAVPAMVTGGEFVLGQGASQKYGESLLNRINEGKVQKFAAGGMVQSDIFGNKRDKDFKYKRQKGNGDYFAPGLYDSGNITGAEDLLSFATQGFTSGKKDFISSPSEGASVISLEPESLRLTNFGRSRGTPLQKATQDAKGQAFDLNIGYQKDYLDYLKRREEEKKAAKAKKKAFLTNLAVSAVTMGLSSGLSGLSNAAKGASSIGQKLTGGQAFKAFFTGGKLPGMESNVGGLFNMFNSRGQQSLNPSQYYRENWNQDFMTPQLKDAIIGQAPKGMVLSNLDDDQKGGNPYIIRATGGYVPNGTGIDDVPAMLTGGEFVLNSAATQRIGTQNLESANAGGQDGLNSGESSEELIEKLEELIDATRENSGEINITVTGGTSSGGGGNNSGTTSTETNETSGVVDDNKKRQELAKQIKDSVLAVIREEKRLGGTLRN